MPPALPQMRTDVDTHPLPSLQELATTLAVQFVWQPPVSFPHHNPCPIHYKLPLSNHSWNVSFSAYDAAMDSVSHQKVLTLRLASAVPNGLTIVTVF